MATLKQSSSGPLGVFGVAVAQAEPAFEVIRLVREGLPVSAVDRLIETGTISAGEIHLLVLPRKTLTNRREVGYLSPEQSDRLVRVARVIAQAEATFGDRDKAHKWLRRPTTPLNDEAPLNLLDTEPGARMVENLLGRISHGIAA